MRRALLAVGLLASLAATVVAIGLGLGWWNESPSGGPPSRQVAVATALSPRPTTFGDLLHAEVDVLYDPSSVHGLRVSPSFHPYLQRGRESVGRSRAGRLELLRYRYVLECLTDACLPVHGPRTVKLPPVRVSARVGARKTSLQVAWPPAVVATHLQPADLTSKRLSFRRPATLPPPAFRVAPGPLADALTAVAGMLVSGGLLLLGLAVRDLGLRARERRRAALGPLESALLYTRESAARPDPADRRKALGLLAETLPDGGEGMATAAERLAWGAPPPTPERTLELADEVEGRA